MNQPIALSEVVPVDFVHLHVHSHFSPDGIASPRELARTARDRGMSALALTDLNSLAGVVEFCTACRTIGIRPVIGAQLTVTSSDPNATTGALYRIVLLVETEPGYRNLIGLINRAHSGARAKDPVVYFHELEERATGLIALAGGASSELYGLLLNDRHQDTERHIKELAAAFGRENVVFEIQDHNLPKQRSINERVYKLAEFLGMRCVATNDVHYLRPEDATCTSFLRGESPPRRLDVRELKNGLTTAHLATPDEMRVRFSKTARTLYATAEIADRCLFQPNCEKRRFPVHDFVRGFDADSFLWDLAFREARNRFPELTAEIKDRLNLEFDDIKNQRLSNHMLLLWNVAQFCRRNQIVGGVGHGDAITSLVAYILGITQVNPLEYKLRFLGFEKLENAGQPLAVEIPARHAGALHTFLKETFGSDCCGVPGHFERPEPDALARELCAWLDLPFASVDEVLEHDGAGDESPRPIESFTPRRFAGSEMTPIQLARYVYSRVADRPLRLTAQSNQVAFSSDNLNQLLARFPADGGEVLQCEASALDELKIPRLVLVPNRVLEVIDQAATWVRKEERPNFEPERIPLDDSDTFELLSRGQTHAIDPFHSIAMKSLLRVHKPRNFMSLLKIKAMEHTPGTEGTDIRDHLPQCLLTYRAAFLRAHYPTSFAAAVLSNSVGNMTRFAVLMREVRRQGIRILPPHVNLSLFEFSVENKAVRTGLMVASGFSARAYAAFADVRRGGDFHDLNDLWSRTRDILDRSTITNLIRIGALDCFGLNRAQMLAMLEGLTSGQTLAMDPPQVPELDSEELLRHEIIAAGYAIASDDLQTHHDLIRRCRALAPHELSGKHNERDVYVAGYIDHVVPGESEHVLLDMEGRLAMMPLKAARLYGAALHADEPVLIGGVAQRRKNEMYLRAINAFTFGAVLEMSRKVIEIEIDISGEDQRTVGLIAAVAAQFRMHKGRTQIRVHGALASAIARWRVRRIQSGGVFFCPPLYYALKKILDEDRISLVTSEQMDQTLLHMLSPHNYPRSGEPVHHSTVDEELVPASPGPAS